MEIIIKNADSCNRFWQCLEPTDWIQIVSVTIAMLAAIASFLTVIQQKKQFKLANEERKMKYRPKYRIRNIDYHNSNLLVIDIEPIEEHYFIPENVYWRGSKELEAKFFKGELSSNKFEGRKDALVVDLKGIKDLNDEGYFEIEGLDIEYNSISIKSPVFQFENGKVKNHLVIWKQFLK